MADLRVSHSQLQVWGRCESAWDFNYLKGFVPKREQEFFSVGTFAHEILAFVYLAMKNGATRQEAIMQMIEWLKTKAPEMIATSPVAFNRAMRICKRYFAEFAPKEDAGLRILDVERHFSVDIPTPGGNILEVEGYIDLIVELQGKMYLWDHKTVGGGKFWTAEEAYMDPQLVIYSLALRLLGYPVFGTIINQLNTYDYVNFNNEPIKKLYRRQETYRPDAYLEGVGRNIGLMADRIIEKRESGGPFIKNLSKACKNCVYREPCTYELKGIDPSTLLRSNFKKKEGRPEEEAADNIFEEIGVYAP